MARSDLADDPPADPHRMTPAERRASVWLAWLYGVRMFGMFLVLPVFVIHASSLPGGEDSARVGFALGVYGLAQALLQIPFGLASDRFGRKPVITVGLALMVVGSLVAAFADSVAGLAVGRALQGAGAVSAAISALVADCTRDSQRSKAMAMVGATIGLSYAVSIVVAPVAYRHIGLEGIFLLTAVLSLTAIGILWSRVPDGLPAGASAGGASVPAGAPPPAEAASPGRSNGASWQAMLADAELLRLNLGIFVLHLVQMALFVVVPGLLVRHAGLPLAEHWKVYLPVVVLAFAVMLGPMNMAERKGRLRPVFVGAVALLACSLLGFAALPPGLVSLALLLFLFFVAFNLLEALLPSLVSRLAPPQGRGLALGIYSTTQALGLFAGGALGGWLHQHFGPTALFLVAGGLALLWCVIALGARRWPGRVDEANPPVAFGSAPFGKGGTG